MHLPDQIETKFIKRFKVLFCFYCVEYTFLKWVNKIIHARKRDNQECVDTSRVFREGELMNKFLARSDESRK